MHSLTSLYTDVHQCAAWQLYPKPYVQHGIPSESNWFLAPIDQKVPHHNAYHGKLCWVVKQLTRVTKFQCSMPPSTLGLASTVCYSDFPGECMESTRSVPNFTSFPKLLTEFCFLKETSLISLNFRPHFDEVDQFEELVHKMLLYKNIFTKQRHLQKQKSKIQLPFWKSWNTP